MASLFSEGSRFALRRRLGSGGMGVVYLAHDRDRHVEVALKTLPHFDPAGLYRLKNEFRSLLGVSHRNLISLYELLQEGETFFFTMEYVEGVAFIDFVRRSGVTSEDATRTAPWLEAGTQSPAVVQETPEVGEPLDAGGVHRLRTSVRQLAEGLGALHGKGLVHRDIKPSNVLVDVEGRVVILDFGLTTRIGESPLDDITASPMSGTYPYLAPEALDDVPGAPADWYAVGIMLYRALTGRMPFAGKGIEGVLERREKDPRPPQELVEGNPDELDALCLALLDRDPDRRPSAEQVLRRLGVVDSAPVPVRASREEEDLFVGREEPLERLAEALRRVQDRGAAMVYLSGESGSGKSEMIEHFLERVRRQDREAVVLAGRCYEQESVPYKALDSVIDRLSHYLRELPEAEAQAVLPRDVGALSRLFPVLERVEAVQKAPDRRAVNADDQDLRRRAFAALRELFGRLGDRRTLILFIDDLQWGDVDSALLIEELLRGPEPPPLLLLTCYRSEYAERSECLRTLGAARERLDESLDVQEIPVGPLSDEEACELARRILARRGRTVSDEEASGIAQESGGIPYFVCELAEYGLELRDEGRVGARPSLDEMIWARVSRLDDRERRLLATVGLSGRPLRQVDALEASGVGGAAFHLIRDLVSRRFVRGGGSGPTATVEPYHDRIRESVVARLEKDERRELHRALAERLEAEESGDAETLAIHFRESGDLPAAMRYSRAAAGQAWSSLAFERAVKLFRTTLELMDEAAAPEEEVREVRERLADALADAGHGIDAAKQYLEAARGAPEPMELWRRAGFQYLASGYVDKGREILGHVSASVGMPMPRSRLGLILGFVWRRLRLKLRGQRVGLPPAGGLDPLTAQRLDLSWAISRGFGMIETLSGAYFQSWNTNLALQAGDPVRVARALAIEASFASALRPGSGEAEQMLERVQALNESMHDPYTDATLLQRAFLGFHHSRYRESVADLEAAEASFLAHCTGVRWELAVLRTFLLWSLGYLGELRALSQRSLALLEEAQFRGDLFEECNLSVWAVPLVYLAADEPDAAEDRIEQAMGRWSQAGFHIQHALSVQSTCFHRLYCGRYQDAWDHVRLMWPLIRRSRSMAIGTSKRTLNTLRGFAALAAAREGGGRPELDRAVRESVRALERLDRDEEASARALVLRAGQAAARGDRDEACAHLREAIELFERFEMGLFVASARRKLGLLLGAEAGRALVSEADDWMLGQGVVRPDRMTEVWCPIAVGEAQPR